MALQHFFPLTWDSTQLAATACPIKFFRQHVQHLAQEESVHLIAGASFARGIHVTRESFYTHGMDEHTSISLGIAALQEEYGDFYCPWNENKSINRMSVALEAYFSHFRLPFDEVVPMKLADGTHSMEYGMVQPIRDLNNEFILHPTLNVPLMFSGRLDLLASYMGKSWIVDEKTTSGYFPSDYGSQWELRGQFSGYSWLAEQTYLAEGISELHGLSGVIVRGVSLPKSVSNDASKRQASYADSGTVKFREHLSHRSEFMVANWHRFMVEKVLQAKESYLRYLDNEAKQPEKFFTGNYGDMCTSYSRACSFMASCKNPDAESFLSVDYPQTIWRPELHQRQPLSEYLLELKQGAVV